MRYGFLAGLSLVLWIAGCSQAVKDPDVDSARWVTPGVYAMICNRGADAVPDTITIKDGKISSAMLAKEGILPAAFSGHSGNTGIFYGAVDERPAVGKVEWDWIGGMSEESPWQPFGLHLRWTKPDGTVVEYHYRDRNVAAQ